MRKTDLIFAIPLMVAALNPDNPKQGREYEPRETPEKPIPKGCKKYTFHGITVVAISEKSARKKIERRLKNGCG